MAKTMGEWDKLFDATPPYKLQRTIDAIKTLKEFEELWAEYSWTGLGVLIMSMGHSITMREK